MPQSKEQISAYNKEYNKKNKEQIAAYHKEYYETNKEQLTAYKKEYRKNNKEQIAAYRKEYYETNKEQIAAYRKEYNKKNKEQIAAYDKEYYETNKEQRNAYNKRWSGNNKEYISAQHREKKYGISPEDYDTMLKEQDNKCKICLVSFTTLKPQLIHVDHCHTTKQVRGLLCNLCNTGLGFFKDNTETLTNAIIYLEHTHRNKNETRTN